MKEPILSVVSRLSFGIALSAIIVALIFSLLRNQYIAEQAGVVTYVFMVFGVITTIADEIRNPRIKSDGIKPEKKQGRAVRRNPV